MFLFTWANSVSILQKPFLAIKSSTNKVIKVFKNQSLLILIVKGLIRLWGTALWEVYLTLTTSWEEIWYLMVSISAQISAKVKLSPTSILKKYANSSSSVIRSKVLWFMGVLVEVWVRLNVNNWSRHILKMSITIFVIFQTTRVLTRLLLR